MNAEGYKLFPTLVVRLNSFLDKQQCADIFAYLKVLDMGEHNAIVGDGKSSFNEGKSYVLADIAKDVASCKNIINDLQKAVEDYAAESRLVISGLGNSWANIQSEGSQLNQHTHPACAIAGALYINTDADSSRLCFDNPNPLVSFTRYLEGEPSEFSFATFCFTPKIGDLILFPSWLRHGSDGEVNKTKDRTVISFNVV